MMNLEARLRTRSKTSVNADSRFRKQNLYPCHILGTIIPVAWQDHEVHRLRPNIRQPGGSLLHGRNSTFDSAMTTRTLLALRYSMLAARWRT